jgi:precorrin-6B methylase 2
MYSRVRRFVLRSGNTMIVTISYNGTGTVACSWIVWSPVGKLLAVETQMDSIKSGV